MDWTQVGVRDIKDLKQFRAGNGVGMARWILLTTLIAIGYAITARLSLLLAISPSEASAVWPPAGIAAGSLILFGKRAGYGVFIGAVLSYLFSWLNLESVHSAIRSISLIILLSTSATVQAMVVSSLVARFANLTGDIVAEKSSLKFIFFLAPLGCLTATLLSNTLFVLYGVSTPQNFFISSLTWWIGDTIGVVTMVPLMLAVFGGAGEGRARQPAVSVAMLCVLSMVFVLFFYNLKREENHANEVFSARVDALHHELQVSFNRSLDNLYALKHFFESDEDAVSRNEFEHFTSFLHNQNLHIQALEWIPRVAGEERKNFEGRGDGPGRIVETDENNSLVPAGSRQEYFPVYYVTPMAGNERAYGYDVSSNPSAAAAQRVAASSGRPVGSIPIKLVQEQGDQFGVVIYLKVEKAGDFVGFVAMVLRIEDFVNSVIASAPGNTDGLLVNIRFSEESPVLLYGDPGTRGSAVPGIRPQERYLAFSSGKWPVSYYPDPSIPWLGVDHHNYYLLIGGMLFVAVFGAWILSIANRAKLVSILVTERTEELRREIGRKELAQRELKKLSQAIKYSPNMVMIIDPSGSIEYVNPKFSEVTGFQLDELLNKPANDLYVHEKGAEFFSELLNNMLREGSWQGEIRCVKKQGQVYWAQMSVAPILDNDEKYSGVVVQMQDVTEQKYIQEKISYQARHDLLTGLVNRYEFERELQRLIDNIHQSGASHAFCFCDLDQFKVVNDTSGHEAGDELLKRVAILLQESFRHNDVVARLGGDEFGVLMENCDLRHAKIAAEKVRSKIEALRFSWGNEIHSIGVSIGIVAINTENCDFTEILKGADAACYTAKDAGRNQVHAYEIGDEKVAKREGEIAWLTEINSALAYDRYELFGQLIVPVSDPQLKPHVEVLLRMRHNGKLVSPSIFLPAAERYGVATKIDQWVIDTVFEKLQKQPGIFSGVSSLMINLSGHSIGNHKLLDSICKELSQGDTDPRFINFEITETAAISNISDAHRFFEQVKAFGSSFSLDDFGSGLSSFAYLKTLPVDYIKIDGMFITDIHTDKVVRAMVKSINDVGQLMGKQTVAEFVESQEIFSVVKELGIDYAQGYAISVPKPLEEALEEAKSWNT